MVIAARSVDGSVRLPAEELKRIVSDGHEVVPAWRIGTPDGDWLILPGQRDRATYLIKRFMAWRKFFSGSIANPDPSNPSMSFFWTVHFDELRNSGDNGVLRTIEPMKAERTAW